MLASAEIEKPTIKMSGLMDLNARTIVFIAYPFPPLGRVICIRELDDIPGLKKKGGGVHEDRR